MRIGVLGNSDSWYLNDLSRAAAERGHRCDRLDFRQLAALLHSGSAQEHCLTIHPNLKHSNLKRAMEQTNEFVAADFSETLTNFDAIIVRTMPFGSLEQVVFRMNLLHRCEVMGVTVLNSAKALECAVDKYLTTATVAAAGLPVPETFVCESAEAAMHAFFVLGGDVVVKPLFGAEGRGILRVSDPDLAFRTFRTLERTQAVLYLQRFIEHGGSDLRLLMFDGELIGAMRRRSTDDFRVNISRTGIAEPYSPTEQEIDFAIRSTAATGVRFGGVDLLYDQQGNPFVIEMNAVPGWRALANVTKKDIAATVIARLEAATSRS